MHEYKFKCKQNKDICRNLRPIGPRGANLESAWNLQRY